MPYFHIGTPRASFLSGPAVAPSKALSYLSQPRWISVNFLGQTKPDYFLGEDRSRQDRGSAWRGLLIGSSLAGRWSNQVCRPPATCRVPPDEPWPSPLPPHQPALLTSQRPRPGRRPSWSGGASSDSTFGRASASASASASADQRPTSQMSFATVPVSYPCQYTSQIKQNNGVTQCSLLRFDNGCNDLCTIETFHNKAKNTRDVAYGWFRKHWDNLAWHSDAPY